MANDRPRPHSGQIDHWMGDPGGMVGEEPFLPETIYQRLDYLETYALFEREGESYDDLSEDEEQLDLTAPPPESLVLIIYNS